MPDLRVLGSQDELVFQDSKMSLAKFKWRDKDHVKILVEPDGGCNTSPGFS
jgi:hypothetical protein